MVAPARRARLKTVLITAIAVLLQALPGAADEVRVMTSGAFTAAFLALAAQFERTTGHRIVIEATSSGTGATSIASRLERGEAIDVVIVDSEALDRLIRNGQVRAGTRVDLARSAIGMAVRQGAPKPDISSLAALRQTLLAARSIAYSSSVSGTYLSTELFQRLGIADQVLPKSRRIVGERVGAVVARGEAEIGFQQVSELLPEAGIDLVGPLPAGAQHVMIVAAGVGTAAGNAALARRLIEFLASSDAIPAIEETALEPLTRRVQNDEAFEPALIR
jgi:molybdate transport system substrate-binding protein